MSDEIKGLDDGSAAERMITLICFDGSVRISVGAAQAMDGNAPQCGFLHSALELDPNITEIKFQAQVEKNVLSKFVEYLEYRAKVPRSKMPSSPLRDTLAQELDEWDYKFVADLPILTVCRLVAIANYTQATNFYLVLSATVASHIRNKRPTEILDMFGLPPPKEEEKRVAEKLFTQLFPEETAAM